MKVIADGGQAPQDCGQAAGAGQDIEQQGHILVRPAEAVTRHAPLHVRWSLAFSELFLHHPKLSREAVSHGQHQVKEIQDTVEAGQGDAYHSNVLKEAYVYISLNITGSSDHKPRKDQWDVLHKHSYILESFQFL